MAAQANAAQSGDGERKVFDAHARFADLKTLDTGRITNHVNQYQDENRLPAAINI
jgi:hypothetical protein